MPLLCCDDVTVGYNGHKVVENVSFAVDKGDYLYIVGENGSGKTTLMKTILGLLPPISGQIIFDDGLKSKEIGYLPQQTLIQRDFPALVQEIVLSGCLNRCGTRPFFNKNERKMAEQTMEQLGILDLSKRSYRELSGGQQQRVLLARALCATQKLLLLDEPVAGLDIYATEDMYTIIKDINEQQGIAVIMISHDIRAAEKYASTILDINQKAFFLNKQVLDCKKQQEANR